RVDYHVALNWPGHDAFGCHQWSLRFLEEILEKLTIENHGLPQLLSGRGTATVAGHDLTCEAVILCHPWVVDGDVGYSPIKVGRDRKAASAEHFLHKVPAIDYRTFRIIDE